MLILGNYLRKIVYNSNGSRTANSVKRISRVNFWISIDRHLHPPSKSVPRRLREVVKQKTPPLLQEMGLKNLLTIINWFAGNMKFKFSGKDWPHPVLLFPSPFRLAIPGCPPFSLSCCFLLNPGTHSGCTIRRLPEYLTRPKPIS